VGTSRRGAALRCRGASKALTVRISRAPGAGLRGHATGRRARSWAMGKTEDVRCFTWNIPNGPPIGITACEGIRRDESCIRAERTGMGGRSNRNTHRLTQTAQGRDVSRGTSTVGARTIVGPWTASCLGARGNPSGRAPPSMSDHRTPKSAGAVMTPRHQPRALTGASRRAQLGSRSCGLRRCIQSLSRRDRPSSDLEWPDAGTTRHADEAPVLRHEGTLNTSSRTG
jgi:hypothetical protein